MIEYGDVYTQYNALREVGNIMRERKLNRVKDVTQPTPTNLRAMATDIGSVSNPAVIIKIITNLHSELSQALNDIQKDAKLTERQKVDQRMKFANEKLKLWNNVYGEASVNHQFSKDDLKDFQNQVESMINAFKLGKQPKISTKSITGEEEKLRNEQIDILQSVLDTLSEEASRTDIKPVYRQEISKKIKEITLLYNNLLLGERPLTDIEMLSVKDSQEIINERTTDKEMVSDPALQASKTNIRLQTQEMIKNFNQIMDDEIVRFQKTYSAFSESSRDRGDKALHRSVDDILRALEDVKGKIMDKLNPIIYSADGLDGKSANEVMNFQLERDEIMEKAYETWNNANAQMNIFIEKNLPTTTSSSVQTDLNSQKINQHLNISNESQLKNEIDATVSTINKLLEPLEVVNKIIIDLASVARSKVLDKSVRQVITLNNSVQVPEINEKGNLIYNGLNLWNEKGQTNTEGLFNSLTERSNFFGDPQFAKSLRTGTFQGSGPKRVSKVRRWTGDELKEKQKELKESFDNYCTNYYDRVIRENIVELNRELTNLLKLVNNYFGLIQTFKTSEAQFTGNENAILEQNIKGVRNTLDNLVLKATRLQLSKFSSTANTTLNQIQNASLAEPVEQGHRDLERIHPEIEALDTEDRGSMESRENVSNLFKNIKDDASTPQIALEKGIPLMKQILEEEVGLQPSDREHFNQVIENYENQQIEDIKTLEKMGDNMGQGRKKTMKRAGTQAPTPNRIISETLPTRIPFQAGKNFKTVTF